MDGWVAEGLDLDDPPVDWSIERSSDRATQGTWSVRYFLANYNDAGKIWLRRAFPVPAGTYDVSLEFGFATADFGMANLWTIIAGARNAAPARVADLPFREHTGHGSDQNLGWVWLPKRYGDTVSVGRGGAVHVMVGVWGTWETPRAYYADEIEVRIRPIGQ